MRIVAQNQLDSMKNISGWVVVDGKRLPVAFRCLCGSDSCYGNEINGVVHWYCTACWIAFVNAAHLPVTSTPGLEGDGHEVLTVSTNS